MDPAILLIIVFIVAPLIERLLKAGKTDTKLPPPQTRMPPPRPQRPVEREPQDDRVIIARREEESAATMLPDDLWEILTGQTRVPQAPAPAPQEETYSAEDEGMWVEAEAEEAVEAEPARTPAPPVRWRSPELQPAEADYVRPIPAREPPRIVSMEVLEFDDEKRHDQFHDRLSRISAPSRVEKRVPLRAYKFTSNADLRRAIVMAEVLGPPKGLE